MTIVLIFVIFYMAVSMWDVGHVNDIVGKMVDPGGYRRAHPAAPVEPAPRLVINLPSGEQPTP
jgi:hypothetical protein